MSARPRVAIDLVPIHAGRGGAGGGIWSYATALVAALDALAPGDVDLVCLCRPDQELGALRHLTRMELPVDTRSPGRRLKWIHRELPAWCRRHDVAILHKLATETPWHPGRTRLVTTVQDFMAEFYREQMKPGAAGGEARDGLQQWLQQWLQRRYFAAVTGRSFAHSEVVLTTTESVATEARRRFPAAADRIRTVPLGVDHLAFGSSPHDRRNGSTPVPAPVPAAEGRPLRLLCVGAFLPHKGQHLAVEAFQRLREAEPALAAGATLTLRGHAADPAYHALVRAAATASPAAAAIRFADYEPGAPPAERYRDADLLLQLSAYEGFGLPPLEAQAAGVPVVCADIPVAREVLADGALFVRRDRPREVADAIARLARSAELRATLVARGHANAGRFSWDRTARETLAVYRSLLEDGPGGRHRGARRAPAR